MSRIAAAKEAEVRRRAGGRCEYCQFPERHAVIPFEVEHVIPVKHRGASETANLALACFYCNRYKGPNVAGVVEPGSVVTRLFHPRVDVWNDHFAWQGARIIPRTAVGEATVNVLRMNQPNALAIRQVLMSEGLWFVAAAE
jgi:hypothetical protein